MVAELYEEDLELSKLYLEDTLKSYITHFFGFVGFLIVIALPSYLIYIWFIFLMVEESVTVFIMTPLLLLVVSPIIIFATRLLVLFLNSGMKKDLSVLLPSRTELDFNTGLGKPFVWFLLIEGIIDFFCLLIFMFVSFDGGRGFLLVAVLFGIFLFGWFVANLYSEDIESAKHQAYYSISSNLFFSYEDSEIVWEAIRIGTFLGFLRLRSQLYSNLEIEQQMKADVQNLIGQFVLDDTRIDYWPDRVIQRDIYSFFVWRRRPQPSPDPPKVQVSFESNTEAEEVVPTAEADAVSRGSKETEGGDYAHKPSVQLAFDYLRGVTSEEDYKSKRAEFERKLYPADTKERGEEVKEMEPTGSLNLFSPRIEHIIRARTSLDRGEVYEAISSIWIAFEFMMREVLDISAETKINATTLMKKLQKRVSHRPLGLSKTEFNRALRNADKVREIRNWIQQMRGVPTAQIEFPMTIEEAKQRIHELSRLIEQLYIWDDQTGGQQKVMIVCRSCGHLTIQGMTKCSNCGAPLA